MAKPIVFGYIEGIDAADVSKYESEKRNLTPKTLLKCAIVLSVYPKQLFNFEFDIKKYKIEQ